MRLTLVPLLLAAACLALPPAARAQPGAAGPCAFNDWIVDLYHRAAAGTPEQAGALRNTLSRVPRAELGPRLRASGLSRQAGAISDFVEAQREIAAAHDALGARAAARFAQRPAARHSLQEMHRVIGRMRCAGDPDWRPAPAAFTSGGTAIPGRRAGGRQAGPPVPVALPVLGLMVLAGIMAVGAGGAVAARYGRRHRRRHRRFPCALPCTLTAPGTALTGRVVDLSQSGAKIRTDHAPPVGSPCRLFMAGTVLEGRVAWTNAHFAGLAIRPALTRQALRGLLARDGPDRSPATRNGAHKGAPSA